MADLPVGLPAFEPETMALRDLMSVIASTGPALARRMQVHPTDVAALEHLAFAPAPMGPGELGARLHLSPAATTEVVDRLERAGHLERHRDLADRRRIRLEPSETATVEVLRHLAGLTGALDALAVDASPEDRAAVQRFLAGAVAVYRRWAEED